MLNFTVKFLACALSYHGMWKNWLFAHCFKTDINTTFLRQMRYKIVVRNCCFLTSLGQVISFSNALFLYRYSEGAKFPYMFCSIFCWGWRWGCFLQIQAYAFCMACMISDGNLNRLLPVILYSCPRCSCAQ